MYTSFIITRHTYSSYLAMPAIVHLPFEYMDGAWVVYEEGNKLNWRWMRSAKFFAQWTMYKANGDYMGHGRVIPKRAIH